MFVSFVDVSDCGAIADFWFLTDRTDNGKTYYFCAGFSDVQNLLVRIGATLG
jgi:hypothetical protein